MWFLLWIFEQRSVLISDSTVFLEKRDAGGGVK